jgi:hypothetical protein
MADLPETLKELAALIHEMVPEVAWFPATDLHMRRKGALLFVENDERTIVFRRVDGAWIYRLEVREVYAPDADGRVMWEERDWRLGTEARLAVLLAPCLHLDENALRLQDDPAGWLRQRAADQGGSRCRR